MATFENDAIFLMDDGSIIPFCKAIVSQKCDYFDARFHCWHQNDTEFR